MNTRNLFIIAAIFYAGSGAQAFTTNTTPVSNSRSYTTSSSTSIMMNNRRNFINNISKVATGALVVGITSSTANALDFDSFANSEIESDTKSCDPKKDPKCIPKLSEDEALCQYGSSGEARGEACLRVRKAGGKLPEVKKEKSLGGAYAM